MKRLGLGPRFSREVERKYQEYYNTITRKQLRFGLICGFAIYALFGILDNYLAPSALSDLWTIRYKIVCPVIVLVFLSLYAPLSLVKVQLLVSSGTFVAGFGIICMTIVAPPPLTISIMRAFPWS